MKWLKEILFYLIAMIMLFAGIAIGAKASEVNKTISTELKCEVMNMDTSLCETWDEQNLSVNERWIKIVGNNK